MSSLAIPFNISILHLTDETLRFIKPVKVLDTFEGSSRNFHEEGLFSQSIFGRVGEQVRNKNFSYIDIKVRIFHPIIYNALSELKSFYPEIMASKTYARWDEEAKDFFKTDVLSGETGYDFFVRHWEKIVFPSEGSEKRKNNVKLIEKYKDVALTSKIVVIPAGLRDYEILDDGRESEDEFNALYRRIIAISSPIHADLINQDNIKQLNNPRNGLQNAFNTLYDKLKSMLEGKHKLILSKWAKRGIFNGTRNVIASANIRSNELGSPANFGANDTVIGLYQYLKGTLPVSKYQIKSDFLSKVFPGMNAPATLVNKQTLKSEVVRLKSHHYDSWMTDEGLDSTISAYGEEEFRSRALEIEDRYIGLMYKGPDGSFKMFQDIDELPESMSREHVTPITFTELLYCAVYPHHRKYPVFVTRYPITGFGSIYPSLTYLKPTINTEVRRPLNDDWRFDDKLPTAYNFPKGNLYVNAMSVSPNRLAGLGGDHDGDTVSANFVYTEEAIEEVNNYLNDRNYYVDTQGKIFFSMELDTTNYLLKTMTGDPQIVSTEDMLSNTAEVNGVLIETGKFDLRSMQKLKPQGFYNQQDNYNDVVSEIESEHIQNNLEQP